MKAFALAGLLGATLITSAHAEDVTISQALAAGSLHEGALDMVAYWIEVRRAGGDRHLPRPRDGRRADADCDAHAGRRCPDVRDARL
jgi:hypothetical protein